MQHQLLPHNSARIDKATGFQHTMQIPYLILLLGIIEEEEDQTHTIKIKTKNIKRKMVEIKNLKG